MALADWQMAYGGLTLDGDTYRIIPPLTGLGDMPDLVSGDQPRLRGDGVTAGDDFLSGRTITMDVMVVAATADFATKLATAFTAFAPTRLAADQTALTFQIPGIAGGGARRLVGRVRKRTVPVDLTWDDTLPQRSAAFAVQFFASDPRIYDDVESTLDTDLEDAGTGHAWPQTWPMDWGGASTSGIITATNSGTYSTPWTATITGPVVNPSVENVGTGDILKFSADGGLTLSDTDTLVVSSATRTAILNGTASRYPKLAAPVTWWDLEPGDTELRFGGSTSGTPTMTVAWRDAYL